MGITTLDIAAIIETAIAARRADWLNYREQAENNSALSADAANGGFEDAAESFTRSANSYHEMAVMAERQMNQFIAVREAYANGALSVTLTSEGTANV